MIPLAIDFGTSNTAAAILVNGRVRRLAIESGAETLPTAVFFPEEGGAMQIGAAAGRALIAGEEGRYMRALKSVLGTALFHDKRLIGGRRRTLAEIVTAFLVALKARAEAEAGQVFTAVLSGRPVHFHSGDPERDARAEADLEGCYRAAGFTEITFLPEPEAAALAAGPGQEGATGLIVDIGGGTSDFSVYRTEAGRVRILASHGIRLGGTDFDQALSLARAMPRLGMGGELRRAIGSGLLPVPQAIYVDLATWAKIPFLYTRDTEREVAEMLRLAVAPKALGRLDRVIREQLGHELAFAVEAAKIAANSAAPGAAVDMGMIEPGLKAPVSPFQLTQAMAAHRAQLALAMADTLAAAGLAAGAVDKVVLVGGSSLMALVEEEARALCPGAGIERSEAFTAVVDGLALATAG